HLGCRPSLYIINLLVPSGFLVAIDALTESENRAPFKMTLLLGYNVFLGTPLISMFALPSGVYFALCLSLMVLSLLETVFIAYLLHLATNRPPPCRGGSTPCCCTAPAQGNTTPLLSPRHLLVPHPHLSLVGKVPGPGEAEPAGGSGWTRAQQEQEAQKRHRVELWVQFSHMMDTLLFRLYLLFMASCILTVIGLWNT
uniref:5-hydroxytryptamine receptor 3D n=1 Tax=Propithecus coquereli TaxID=379532 RepID=A0A2K6F585_PROCO